MWLCVCMVSATCLRIITVNADAYVWRYVCVCMRMYQSSVVPVCVRASMCVCERERKHMQRKGMGLVTGKKDDKNDDC